jgi:quercetin dioxygenase-like cupin family protein
MTLTLTPKESLTIRESSPHAVEVEVTYGEHGDPPPAHLHPDQDEAFEVLAGVIHARIDGEERTYGRGERFEIPRGVAHQMWNPAGQPARASWRTSPPGRTHEWFAAPDELQRSGRVDKKGMPGPLAMGVLLTHYRDVFQLAARPPHARARRARCSERSGDSAATARSGVSRLPPR